MVKRVHNDKFNQQNNDIMFLIILTSILNIIFFVIEIVLDILEKKGV
jgi:preprotein translocase subunit SecG